MSVNSRIDESFSNIFKKYGYTPEVTTSGSIFEQLEKADAQTRLEEKVATQKRATKLNESFASTNVEGEEGEMVTITYDNGNVTVEKDGEEVINQDITDETNTEEPDEATEDAELADNVEECFTEDFSAKEAEKEFNDMMNTFMNKWSDFIADKNQILTLCNKFITSYFYGNNSAMIKNECLTEDMHDEKNDSGEGHIINPAPDETGMIAEKTTNFDRGNKPAKIFEENLTEAEVSLGHDSFADWFETVQAELGTSESLDYDMMEMAFNAGEQFARTGSAEFVIDDDYDYDDVDEALTEGGAHLKYLLNKADKLNELFKKADNEAKLASMYNKRGAYDLAYKANSKAYNNRAEANSMMTSDKNYGLMSDSPSFAAELACRKEDGKLSDYMRDQVRDHYRLYKQNFLNLHGNRGHDDLASREPNGILKMQLFKDENGLRNEALTEEAKALSREELCKMWGCSDEEYQEMADSNN